MANLFTDNSQKKNDLKRKKGKKVSNKNQKVQ